MLGRRREVTVGRGPLGVGVGCLPLFAISALALVLIGCVGIASEEEGGGRRMAVGLCVLSVLAIAPWIYFAWPGHRLIFVVRPDALILRQGRTSQEFKHSSVGMVELTLARAATAYLAIWTPDGASLGGWEPRWVGLKNFKLLRALRRFGYPCRQGTSSTFTGKYVDQP
jgi:hypothetical protein